MSYCFHQPVKHGAFCDATHQPVHESVPSPTRSSSVWLQYLACWPGRGGGSWQAWFWVDRSERPPWTDPWSALDKGEENMQEHAGTIQKKTQPRSGRPHCYTSVWTLLQLQVQKSWNNGSNIKIYMIIQTMKWFANVFNPFFPIKHSKHQISTKIAPFVGGKVWSLKIDGCNASQESCSRSMVPPAKCPLFFWNLQDLQESSCWSCWRECCPVLVSWRILAALQS